MSAALKLESGDSIDPSKIPPEMRELPRWVCWRLTERKGKATKVPFQARRPLVNADSTDPATWAGFDVALSAYRDPANRLDGIGFVFAEEGPYAGVDLDNCLDDGGNVLEWAGPHLDRLVGYAEVSPSGRGVKVFVRGDVPEGKGRKLQRLGPDHKGAIEVYDRGRFFTVTSRRLDGHAEIGEGGAGLAELHAEWFPAKSRGKAEKPARVFKADPDLVRLIERSKQGPKFSALWGGAVDGYPSKSEADLALCSILAFWTGGDVGAVDRMFRQSRLACEKWDRIDYRERTIDRACNLPAFYDPRHHSRPVPEIGIYQAPDEPSRAKDEPPGDAGAVHPIRPIILISTDEMGVNDEAIRALGSDPGLFCRGARLVTVRRERRKSKLIKRPDGSPWIAELPRPTLREKMSRAASWRKVRRIPNTDATNEVDSRPPDWSVSAVESRGEWDGIRHLEGIIEAPALLADGSILDTAGYDEASGLVYEPNCEFPPIPTIVGQEDATKAAGELLYVVADFPFPEINDDGGAAHRAAWLASLLTPLARYAIDGPCPLFLTDANTSGAGKSKLVDIVAIIATGRIAARTAFPESDEEMRKQILSVAIEGDRMVLIDNVATGAALGGASLDMALTATAVKGRILGKTEMSREVPIFTVWYATGNNLGLRGDMLRRVVPMRLESPEERPEERRGFRIPGNLLHYVQDHRGPLVVAALTILRGYFQAGQPQADLTPMDYPAWCGIVRQSIHWATGVDPCSTRRELIADDGATNQIRAVVAGWKEMQDCTNKPGGLTSAEAIKILGLPEHAEKFATLRTGLMEWSNGTDLPSPRSIGMRLKEIKGRVVDGLTMKGRDSHHTLVWSAVPTGKGGTSGSSGTSTTYAGKLSPDANQKTNGDNLGYMKVTGPTRPTSPTPRVDLDRGDAWEGD